MRSWRAILNVRAQVILYIITQNKKKKRNSLMNVDENTAGRESDGEESEADE